MSGTNSVPVTTDPKWKSFLAAFDKSPTDEQLQGREEEISQTLAGAANTTAGLKPELRGKHEKAVADLRHELAALRTEPARDRFSKMEALLRKAAAVAKKCDADAKDKKNRLSAAQVGRLSEVESEIGGAEKLVHPGLKAGMAEQLKAVKDQLQEANGKQTSRDYYRVLEKIDVTELKAARREAQKVDMFLSSGLHNLQQSQEALDTVQGGKRDGDEFEDASAELGRLRKEFEALKQADPKGDGFPKACQDFYLETSTLMTAAKKLVAPEDKEGKEKREELKGVQDGIEAIQRQAQNVLDKCGGVPFLKGLLDTLRDEADTLDQAKRAALGQGTPEEQLAELKKVGTTPAVAATTKVQDALKGIPRMFGGVEELLAGLKDGNAKAAMAKELAKRKTEFEQAMQTAGSDLGKIKAQLVALIKDVAKVTKQDETALLLQAQFGVTTEKLGKHFKPNLKGTYEALSMVPDSHVGQDRLQKVVFDYTKVKPYGEYGDSVITMQGKVFDYTRVTATAYKLIYKEKPFVVDGKEFKPNHFNVTMLHEIGHSVDDKHNIMDGVQSGSGFGQWKDETADKVVTKCTESLVDELKVTDKAKQDKIKECIQAAVTGDAPKKAPNDLKAEWKAVEARCKVIAHSRDPKEPWYKPDKSIEIDGRIYHESYGGTWVSYAKTDRAAGPTVSSYQWRAPGEWFAVLYSVAWMKKETPAALKGKLDEWMPQS